MKHGAKAPTILALAAEGCNAHEIALAVGTDVYRVRRVIRCGGWPAYRRCTRAGRALRLLTRMRA